MANKQASIISRIFNFLGKIINVFNAIISIIFVGFFILFINVIFADNLLPMPERGALYLAPSGTLVDQISYIDPLDQLLTEQHSETLVRDIVEALDAASSDDRITHLLLDTDYLQGAGIAKLQEIGAALLRFKKSGKPIIAVADNFSQSQYFLAAHGDKILLNPMGAVMITGFGAYGNYYKEALDKLKVNVHIFRAGMYKSAIEPFSRNDMSEQSREETADLINRLWQHYSSHIEQLRNLDKGSIDNFANNLHSKFQAVDGNAALLAQQEGLVDQLATRSEIRTYLNEQIPNNADGEFNATDMDAYLAHVRREEIPLANNKIAVVVAKGTILDGDQPEGNIGGDTLAQILAELKYNAQIKALVLRVDSPGGGAFASDVIRDALAAVAQREIPIVVSMGSYAASGGYWIAAEADKILAMPTTITGSIGVYSIIPTVEDSLAALGIHSDGVGSTNIAGITHLDRPMSEQAKIILQNSVDNIYKRFIELVANGRQISTEALDKITGGRVWTGEQALELGLVDQLGGLDAAIKVAAELAEISNYNLIYPDRVLTPYEQLLQEINRSLSASLARLGIDRLPSSLYSTAQSLLTPLIGLDDFNDPRGLYLHCDRCPL